ncbi:MAG TPA: cytochrome b [Steroidobacteraceae bacterium]|jgi:cytochrome b561
MPAVIDALAMPTVYTRTAVVFHWLIALLITAGFSLGAYMVDLHISPRKLRLYNYHKWIGITILGLVLLRSLWRLTHKPPPEEPMPRWQAHAARFTHGLLYALMIVTPIFGWLYSSASGYSVVYLKLWQLPDLVHKNKDLAKVLVEIHGDLAWALLWVVVLHAAAAFKHHFIDHDATLKRMLAWRR